MKKIALLFTCLMLFLTACNTKEDNTDQTLNIDQNYIVESNKKLITENEELETGSKLEFAGLSDDKLLDFIDESVYQTLISELDENYYIESVESMYYPKEYIESLSFNSKKNNYFGYTADELNSIFGEKKYVFTLGADGYTVAEPLETLNDDVYVNAMENVIIGEGVILVCVTIARVAGPFNSLAAVSGIFAVSATTAKVCAQKSGIIGFISAAIAKGYETESFTQAIKAGAVAGGESFKWGAITGAITGGVDKYLKLSKLTESGLTLNKAALIQRESKFKPEIIRQLKSYEEYNVYKSAELSEMTINGKEALGRKIPLDYTSELPNGTKVTNLERMLKGYAPIEPASGSPYELHHMNQKNDGSLAILTKKEHDSACLHDPMKKSEIIRTEFNSKTKPEFWISFALSCID